jgi:hypothetical protein
MIETRARTTYAFTPLRRGLHSFLACVLGVLRVGRLNLNGFGTSSHAFCFTIGPLHAASHASGNQKTSGSTCLFSCSRPKAKQEGCQKVPRCFSFYAPHSPLTAQASSMCTCIMTYPHTHHRTTQTHTQHRNSSTSKNMSSALRPVLFRQGLVAR